MSYNAQINTDFQIDYTNKRVYQNSGSTVYSTRDLYSWLMDSLDEINSMDDTIPMTAQTPTDYTMVNGWFIDDASVKWLKGGALRSSGWNNVIYVVAFGGTYTNAVAGDIGKTVVQGANNGTLLAYDNTAKKWWVRGGTGTIVAGATTITSGTGAGTSTSVTTGEAMWSNVYAIGTLGLSGSQLYVKQNGTKLTGWWGTGLAAFDVLVKVQESGSTIATGNMINAGVVTVLCREWGYSFDGFDIDLSGGGRSAVPISNSSDINNTTAVGTVGGYTGITVTFGTVSKTLSGQTKNYDVVVDCGGNSWAKVYEYLKYLTYNTQTATLNGLQGQLYVSANASYATTKTSPFGSYAGGTLFGAQGVWFANPPTSTYQVTADDGTIITPPITASVTVSGVVANDRVSVFRRVSSTPGSAINKAQLTTATATSGAGTFTTTGAIPADTPAAGWVRIGDTSYQYASWTGSTFTLTGTLSQTYTAQPVWIPLIDTIAAGTAVTNSLIYSADIPVLVRVRSYANKILPFEVEGTVTSTGLSVTAIRTADSIAV